MKKNRRNRHPFQADNVYRHLEELMEDAVGFPFQCCCQQREQPVGFFFVCGGGKGFEKCQSVYGWISRGM